MIVAVSMSYYLLGTAWSGSVVYFLRPLSLCPRPIGVEKE